MRTIRFDRNKNNQKVAYQWMTQQRRWVRMSLDEAELLAASKTVKVFYGPNPDRPGEFKFTKIDELTTQIIKIN